MKVQAGRGTAWHGRRRDQSGRGEAADAAAVAATVAAAPDPAQVTVGIILDDSGSMAGEIEDAKAALARAVAAFDQESCVGLIALNAGPVLPVVSAADAAERLSAVLETIPADGSLRPQEG